jgi:voltage-gated potassium channel
MVVTGFLIAEVTIVGCCFAVLQFEFQDPTANIKDAADVLWWLIVTMSTVGYGDFYPLTVGGRFMAALLMFVGIGLFSMLAGVFADTLGSAAIEVTEKKK